MVTILVATVPVVSVPAVAAKPVFTIAVVNIRVVIAEPVGTVTEVTMPTFERIETLKCG